MLDFEDPWKFRKRSKPLREEDKTWEHGEGAFIMQLATLVAKREAAIKKWWPPIH